MEEKLDLRKIIGIMKRYAGLILLMGIVGALVAGLVSYYFLAPTYQSSTQILISQGAVETQELSEQNIEADLQMVNTYSRLIESPVILEKVIDRLFLSVGDEELRDQITVDAEMDSQLIDIAVTDQSQRQAAEIANMTATVFQEEVQNIMNLNNVKILSPAVVNNDVPPISPEPLFNIVIGAAVGLLLGIGTAFLLAYLDTSIKDEEDVHELLGLPVLAVISPVDSPAGEGKTAKVALKQKEA